MSFNKVFLVGNLGHDPELKLTKKDKPFCRINIATNDRSVNAQGDEYEKTTWHMVHVFGKQAEWACSRLVKGSRVFVEARLEKTVEGIEGGENGDKKVMHFLRAYQLTSFSPAPRTEIPEVGISESFFVPNA